MVNQYVNRCENNDCEIKTPQQPVGFVTSRPRREAGRTYVGRLERGESGVTVDSLAAILAPLGVSLSEFFKPFKQVVKPRASVVRAKNFEALHELYLSDDATVHVQNVAPQRRQLLGTTCTRPTAVG